MRETFRKRVKPMVGILLICTFILSQITVAGAGQQTVKNGVAF